MKFLQQQFERLETIVSSTRALATRALAALNGGSIFSGTTQLVNGTKTIPAPFLTANTSIVASFFVPNAGGGVGTAKLAVTSRVVGVSFSIDAFTSNDVFNNLDTSTVDWIAVVNP